MGRRLHYLNELLPGRLQSRENHIARNDVACFGGAVLECPIFHHLWIAKRLERVEVGAQFGAIFRGKSRNFLLEFLKAHESIVPPQGQAAQGLTCLGSYASRPSIAL